MYGAKNLAGFSTDVSKPPTDPFWETVAHRPSLLGHTKWRMREEKFGVKHAYHKEEKRMESVSGRHPEAPHHKLGLTQKNLNLPSRLNSFVCFILILIK